jgi:hypothetical protein
VIVGGFAECLALCSSRNAKSMKCSGKEDLVLERSMKPLVARINMYKKRYGTVLMLVSMFGGCRE